MARDGFQPLAAEYGNINPSRAVLYLFGKLMGVFADSVLGGWGMLLMDRFFMREPGIDRR